MGPSDFRGGEVQGHAVAPLLDRGWVCVGSRGESGVCCSRSLCCVNAMTSYLVCVVRRVKHEGEQRMLCVCNSHNVQV